MGRLCLLAVVLWAAAAAAEPYRIELREVPAAGKSVVVRQQTRQEVQRQVRGPDGKVIHTDDTSLAETDEHTLSVQKAKGSVPTHFTREYLRAEVVAGGEKKALPHQG